jgi:spore maturation protein CgeB
MRVMIVDTYYPSFLRGHYMANPSLAGCSYRAQLASVLGECFGTSDAYSRAFRLLGDEAEEVVVNCEPLQLAWAAEHGAARWARKLLRGSRHPAGRRIRNHSLQLIAAAQIEAADPDVVYMQAVSFLNPRILDRLRARGYLLVGQIATTPPRADTLRRFDLLISSLPRLVGRFQDLGIDAEYIPLAFDPLVVERAARRGQSLDPAGPRPYPVTFVGGFDSDVHAHRAGMLEKLCQQADLTVWGYGAETLPADSPILRRYRGEAWGLDMYAVLGQSRITINTHRPLAEGFANTMRLFEATGAGALLLTEEAPNLPELFDPGSEVIAYSGLDDLMERIRHYRKHDGDRVRVAAAGQARTLRDHTYERRIAELASLLERRIAA